MTVMCARACYECDAERLASVTDIVVVLVYKNQELPCAEVAHRMVCSISIAAHILRGDTMKTRPKLIFASLKRFINGSSSVNTTVVSELFMRISKRPSSNASARLTPSS